ncbi:hypothetical protein COV19_05320, partial [Candidatus Woesearchaeota archaeon CG10_big_fil_rev_8_21_14_0_10_44_13]
MKDKNMMTAADQRRRELAERIALCNECKRKVMLLADTLRQRHDEGLIDEVKYKHQLYSQLKGKEPGEWIRYYDSHIEFCNGELDKEEPEADPGPRSNGLALVAVLLFVMFCAGLFIDARLTGFAVLDDAGISAEKGTYDVGDIVSLSIAPSDADYDIGVYDPEGKLYANALNFPVEDVGTYTVKARLVSGDETKEVSTSFEVIEKSREVASGQKNTAEDAAIGRVYDETEDIPDEKPAEKIPEKSFFTGKQTIEFDKADIKTGFEKDEENRIIPVS